MELNLSDTTKELLKEVEGKKFDHNKLQLELIPVEYLWLLAAVLTMGGIKYDEWNWFRGFDWSRAYGAVLRHLTADWAGEDLDSESGLLHLAHAAVELMFMIMFKLHKKGTDDRPMQARISIDGLMSIVDGYRERISDGTH